MPEIPPRAITVSADPTLVDSSGNISHRKGNDNSSDTGAPPPYQLSAQQVASELEVDIESGLEDAHAQERLQRYGTNELAGGDGVSWVRVLVSQIVNAIMLVMIASLVVSLAIKSWIEGGIIGAVILVNIVVGFMQQYSAERTMDSLRSLASPSATVIRNTHNVVIPSVQLVPGDIVVLTTGDVVPADLRLFDAMNFEADESLLTGESVPVSKQANVRYDTVVPLGDRHNMAYSSSTVTKGRAQGIVTATGMRTEIGAIAASLQGQGETRVRKVREREDGKKLFQYYVSAYALTVTDNIGRFLGVNVGTPLQRRMSQLACALFGIAVLFAIVVVAANNFVNERVVIIYAVSTGLCMIPVSLVVVLTLTFALSAKRMAEYHVIVRKLDSIEALGAVSDVCSDKTGTLTRGRMVARVAWVPTVGMWTLKESRDPFNPHDGKLTFHEGNPVDRIIPESESSMSADGMEKLLECAALCNVAAIAKEHTEEGSDEKEEKWAGRGDPTEIALQVFAHRFDRGRPSLVAQGHEQLAEYPFSSDLKRMTVIYRRPTQKEDAPQDDPPGRVALMKGATERVLDACVSIHAHDGARAIKGADQDVVMQNAEAMAEQGLRVLALAGREWTGPAEGAERAEVEKDMTFYGLIGIYDPPRPESAPAVEDCKRAGIVVHMLTGDHPSTATAIAREIGIIPHGDLAKLPKGTVVAASDFDRLSDEEVDQMEELPRVIGRCSPETKVRMIEALHRRKRFAAMTGDGVNDSPSLSRADVGIGMGSGSDVAKNASDIVLSDDNFASIIAAIREGRRSYDNIKSFTLHLLAGNVAQAIVLLVGLVFKDQENLSVFPLSPVEVLWVVVISAGPPAMGLGMQAATENIMRRPPHNARRGILTTEVLVDMVAYGIILGALSLASFVAVVYGFGDGDLGAGDCNESRAGCEVVFRARATCFATVCTLFLVLAWEMTNLRRSLFRGRPRAATTAPWTQWMRDLYANRVLFWSVVLGFFATFLAIYIPVINDVVFLHAPISWEWIIVFVAMFVFLVCAEGWKLAKRIYYRREDREYKESIGDVKIAA
ncbi:sodium transport ATPase [Epithele typhae]|uniref:sodium transport ATPase n=1 Tax=Epithele typhae TaxID=378194 RepID=UPI002007877E|nr:sodium transport ATPase [Epithele typhae]KAH9930427.1 sodium transport ATPase [Epithele typhae]